MSFAFHWVSDSEPVEEYVSFFVSNVDPGYISYSEMQWGRATSAETWSEKLPAMLRKEFKQALSGGNGLAGRRAIARARTGHVLVGLALVGIERSAPTPFAVLEDLVILQSARGTGIGRKFVAWLESELVAAGVFHVYLESGIRNEGAHRFFENNGYEPIAKVMKKTLHASCRTTPSRA